MVISIIALLIAIFLPALARARAQTKAVVCGANLRQWAQIFMTYAVEHDDNMWFNVLEPYSEAETMNVKSNKFWCCPMATKTWNEGARPGLPTSAWYLDHEDLVNDIGPAVYGSYGINAYIYNAPWKTYWKTINVAQAYQVPLFMDCKFFEIYPKPYDSPPPVEEFYDGNWLQNEMRHSCMDRHKNRTINCAFLDSSVKKVPLKCLWTLKWHRTFDVKGKWTPTGPVKVQPEDWPDWMRKYPECRTWTPQ